MLLLGCPLYREEYSLITNYLGEMGWIDILIKLEDGLEYIEFRQKLLFDKQ